MRIKNPETSEIAYIQEEFNLTDSEGSILKKISFNELKDWIEYESSINLSDKEKQFIKSCVENLGCTLTDKITHVLKEDGCLVFCGYDRDKLQFLDNIQIKGFNEMKEGVIYSLKEIGL